MTENAFCCSLINSTKAWGDSSRELAHFVGTHGQVSCRRFRLTHPACALLGVFYRMYFRETQMGTLKRNRADCVCRLFVPCVHACQKGERLIPSLWLRRVQKLAATMGCVGIWGGERDALERNALFFDFTHSSQRGRSRSALDVEAKLNTLSVIVLAATLWSASPL